MTVPDKCSPGFFCPDEQDDCQALLAVGSSCQLNRDGASWYYTLSLEGGFLILFAVAVVFLGGDSDECEAPPNFKELADNSGLGLNVNGSVCLNNLCM